MMLYKSGIGRKYINFFRTREITCIFTRFSLLDLHVFVPSWSKIKRNQNDHQNKGAYGKFDIHTDLYQRVGHLNAEVIGEDLSWIRLIMDLTYHG